MMMTMTMMKNLKNITNEQIEKGIDIMLILLLVFLITSITFHVSISTDNHVPCLVQEYDRCEYVITPQCITHKGNCKFCIERQEILFGLK